jgi:hypothetical protein
MKFRLAAPGAIVLGLALLAPVAPSDAAPKPVPVVADELPAGHAPRIPYVQGTRLVRPGHTSVSLGGVGYAVVRVRHGYLVSVTRSLAGGKHSYDIYFVPARGQHKRLFLHTGTSPQGNGYDLQTATPSTDGRLVAIYTKTFVPKQKKYLVVKRVSDGRTIAVRRTPSPQVLAFRGSRILLNRYALTSSGETKLMWWNVKTDRTRTVATLPPGLATAWDGLAMPRADLRVQQLAVNRGERQVVRAVPGHEGPRWRTRANEQVQSWSPNGAYVVSAQPGKERWGYYDTPVAHRLLVRRAGTGEIVQVFTGLFAVDVRWHHAPVWETSDSLLLSAWSSTTDADHPRPTGRRLIRCTISTASCTKVLAKPKAAAPRMPFAVRR